MPPGAFSRYYFCEGVDDFQSPVNFYLTEREPYRFRVLTDTEAYVVREGDTLQFLAHRSYQGFRRPAGLWWIIGDFQPIPVIDPTIKLQAGRTVYIPSPRVLREEIFNEARRSEVAEDII